jgi:hypothetical protein
MDWRSAAACASNVGGNGLLDLGYRFIRIYTGHSAR